MKKILSSLIFIALWMLSFFVPLVIFKKLYTQMLLERYEYYNPYFHDFVMDGLLVFIYAVVALVLLKKYAKSYWSYLWFFPVTVWILLYGMTGVTYLYRAMGGGTWTEFEAFKGLVLPQPFFIPLLVLGVVLNGILYFYKLSILKKPKK